MFLCSCLGIVDENNPPGRVGASIDAVIAGLIIVVIANILLILAYGYSALEDDEEHTRHHSGSELSGGKTDV